MVQPVASYCRIWLIWYIVTDWYATDIYLQEHIIRTCHGSVSVAVYGDQDKPALITYPDLGLNCK